MIFQLLGKVLRVPKKLEIRAGNIEDDLHLKETIAS